MKILVLTRNYLRPDTGGAPGEYAPVGGAEQYIDLLLPVLKDAYPEAEIVVYQVGSDEAQSVKRGGASVHFVRLSRFERMFFPLALAMKYRHLVQRELGKDDILIVNEVRYAALVQSTPMRSIGIFHGIEWDTSLASYVCRECRYRYGFIVGPVVSAVKYIYFRLIAPWATLRGLARTRVTVSVDHQLPRWVASRSPSLASRLVTITNCSTYEPSLEPRGPMSEPGDRRCLTILVPRNLNVARGVYLIPDLARTLARQGIVCQFEIAGDGPLRAYIEKRVRALGLQESVRLLGHIGGRREMSQLYQRADVVLIPSVFSEGTSLSAIEAMAHGRALVTTDVGGLSEIGVNGVSKLVVEPTVSSMAAAIGLLSSDPEVRERLGRNAVQYVREHCSLSSWQRQWSDLLESLERAASSGHGERN